MLRHEKPFRVIQGRKDVPLAIQWLLLEYGEMDAEGIREALHREFHVMRNFSITIMMVHHYAKQVANQVVIDSTPYHPRIKIYSIKEEEEGACTGN